MTRRWSSLALMCCATACDDASAVTDGAIGCETAAHIGAAQLAIAVDGQPRTYLLAVPDGYEPGTPMPVVFAWHGLGGTSRSARSEFGIEMASGDAALLVYPQALAVIGGETGWDLAPDGSDVALFDAMLQQLDDQNCVDRTRVFSAGHSFGAHMTMALGCYRSDVLRGIGAVAGGPPRDECEPGGIAAILVHGELDEVVSIEQGRMARDQLLERNGCDDTSEPVDPAPCVIYDGCDPELRWCEHPGGHAWPSFASESIWAFFAGS